MILLKGESIQLTGKVQIKREGEEVRFALRICRGRTVQGGEERERRHREVSRSNAKVEEAMKTVNHPSQKRTRSMSWGQGKRPQRKIMWASRESKVKQKKRRANLQGPNGPEGM